MFKKNKFGKVNGNNLHLSLVNDGVNYLDLSLTKTPSGKVTAYIYAGAEDEQIISRLQSLTNIRGLFDRFNLNVMENLSPFDKGTKSVVMTLDDDDAVRRAISAVTNPYLGKLTFASFGHDTKGLYNYWENQKLAKFHEALADFLPGKDGDESREYLRNHDRFKVKTMLGKLFNKTAREIAQGFKHETKEPLTSLAGRLHRRLTS